MKKKLFILLAIFLMVGCSKTTKIVKQEISIPTNHLFRLAPKTKTLQFGYDQYYFAAFHYYESAKKSYLEGHRETAIDEVVYAIDLLRRIHFTKNDALWKIVSTDDLLNQSLKFYEKMIKNIYDLYFDNSGLIVSNLVEDILDDKKKITQLRKWEDFTILGIPYTEDQRVQKQIDFFTTTYRWNFEKWLSRSGFFSNWMTDSLFTAGLPDELFYLSMIESGFSVRAYSKAAASGLWQFIESTGRSYDLKVDFWYDERKNPYAATNAAIRHLKDLYNELGDWYLVLAAYNAGIGKVKSAMRKDNTKNYWEMKHLPRETQRYVPRFLAAMHICRNLEDYGFDQVEYEAPFKFETVKINKFLKLSKIASAINTPLSQLKFLNPELIKGYTHPEIKDYPLRIPVGKKGLFNKVYPSLKPDMKKFFYEHKLKKNESLWNLAQKYKTSTKLIMTLNKITNPKRLRPGKIILIPIEAK